MAAGCNSTDSAEQTQVAPGTYVAGNGSSPYFVDSSFGGRASSYRIARQFYGRLVSVASCDPVSRQVLDVVHRNFVVDPQAESEWDPTRFELQTNAITGAQTLCIFEDFSDVDNGGRQRFIQNLVEAEGGVQPVADNGFVGIGTFTMTPRNAAFVVVFDELIDATTINNQSVRILVGEPTVIPFAARIFADPNHGDVADLDGQPGAEFYSTRIIIDPAISDSEAMGTTDIPNTLGFPPSQDVDLANIEVRIPTRPLNGQVQPVLQNPTAHAMTTESNGSFDFGTLNREVVRAFRSGGTTSVTADPSNGFLPDECPPQLIGTQAINITLDPQPLVGRPLEFLLPEIQFTSILCAQDPRRADSVAMTSGDIISVGAVSAEVINNQVVDEQGLAENVEVRLVDFPTTFLPEQFQAAGSGPAQYSVAYDPTEDSARPECFVRVSPTVALPDTPNAGISPDSTFQISFSEPIDPDLFEPYESFVLSRIRTANEFADIIPGAIFSDASLQEYRFDPLVPLTRDQGAPLGEEFFLTFPAGDSMPRDLAGNPVRALPAPTDANGVVRFTLDTSASTELTGGRVSRFNAFDEEPPFANFDDAGLLNDLPMPEWFGQINYDFDRGRIRPRPVVRNQLIVSGNNAIPAAMQVGTGTPLPLNPLGARTQFVWRYADFGIPLYDDDNIASNLDLDGLNVDVEGAWLSPLGGNPVFESYPDFRIRMAHSLFLPDEIIDPMTGALVVPTSGIASMFDANILSPQEDPFQEVHPRQLGYTINPGDQTLAADNTPLIPLPINQDVPEALKRFYTWRDTALMTRGGPDGFGAPPARVVQVTGVGPTAAAIDAMGMIDCTMAGGLNPIYFPDEVRTAALPLLFDIAAFSSNGAATSNVFNHNLAHPTTLPGFRAFSSGGQTQGAQLVIIDPDTETVANGGFDPTSTPPGNPTPGVDNVVYFGALDLVVRVSRASSVYFPASDPRTVDTDMGPSNGGMSKYIMEYISPSYSEPVLFPASQPQGTRIDLAYRGAIQITAGSIVRTNASLQDAYGDFYGTTPINFTPIAVDVGDEFIGGASCFDGSFNFFVMDENVDQGGNAIGFLNNDNRWKDTVAEISGARLFQVRLSFVSNATTGQTAELSSISFAWEQ